MQFHLLACVTYTKTQKDREALQGIKEMSDHTKPISTLSMKPSTMELAVAPMTLLCVQLLAQFHHNQDHMIPCSSSLH